MKNSTTNHHLLRTSISRQTAGMSLVRPVLTVVLACTAGSAQAQSVVGWGSNLQGQLNGTSSVGAVIEISSGIYHNVGARQDGTIVAWGSNNAGQLDVPTPALTDVTYVSAGDYHSIAARANGTAACWGDNFFGACDIPVGLNNVVGVSAGEQFSGALLADGTVVVWGWDSLNRLGVPADLTRVIKLDLGADFGVALRSTGDVVAWGTGARAVPPLGLLAKDISAGVTHSIAIRLDGTLACWGTSNAYGECTPPAEAAGSVAVAAGSQFSLGLRSDGKVVCWGKNNRGQAPAAPGFAPVTNGVAIAAGFEHSIASQNPAGIQAPTATLVAATATSCGNINGAIDVTVTNAETSWWTGPNGFFSNSDDLSGLAAGSYTLLVVGPGGSATLSVEVTAGADTIAPVIASYNASASAPAGANCTAIVPDFTASVVASDNCTASGALTITQSPAAGASVGLGANTVVITVKDASLNQTTANATFTVSGTAVTYYNDADHDGFGAINDAGTSACSPIVGKVVDHTDCNDMALTYGDGDSDGYGAGVAVACGVLTNNDCNDASAAIHPGAPELCADSTVDNNCDGVSTSVDTNAPDQVYFYLDYDCDGYAGGSAIRACSPPSGCWSKWLRGDCIDSNPAIHPGAPELCADSFIDNNCDGLVNVDTNAADKIDFYRDQDLDTYSINVTAEFCPGTTNPGWIPTLSSPIDCNDLVAAIHPSAPELCNGIDDNCNGAIDETCQNVELALQILQQAFEPEGAFVVRVNAATPALVVELIAFQCGMRFDATRLELVEVVPVAGGPLATEIGEIVDNANGALRYAVGALAPASGMVSSASLFDIRFRVKPDADLCAQTVELVRFETIEGVSAVFVAIDQSAVVPSLVAAPTFDLDLIGPVFENVPSNIVRPTDAGSTFGAFIADPLVEATDACSEASVSLAIAFPDSTTASTWPTDSMFPIGITTIVWTAVDASGNPSTESRTIEVGAYQMLDASIELIGVFDTSLPEFARSIRLTVGSSTAVHQVGFVAPSSNSTSRVGLRANVQIAVAAALPCARAKDTRYSITDAVTVEINGTHYRARFQLKQGDSNNDDVIDIFDFGMWYNDLGAAASDHRSNFNADGFVNTADFGWIGLNFFARGETCGGLVAGPEPTARVSTKELRRRGLGALAAADINGDGWLDERDMRNAVESPVRPAAAPTASEFHVSW